MKARIELTGAMDKRLLAMGSAEEAAAILWEFRWAILPATPEELYARGIEGARRRLEELLLPEGVSEIRRLRFRNCAGLKRIVLPEGVRTIGDGAFAGCSGLEEVVLPETVTSIGAGAFLDCVKLRRAVLPEGLADIGYGAFRGCGALEDVGGSAGLVIPTERHVFDGCDWLDASGLRFAPGRGDPDRDFPALEAMLDVMTRVYLDGCNSVHGFRIVEMDRPGDGELEAPEGGLDEEILAWAKRAVFDGIEIHRRERPDGMKHVAYMRDIVADTLRRVGAEVYRCAEDDNPEFEKYEKLWEVVQFITDMRFLQVGDRWFALYGDWSD